MSNNFFARLAFRIYKHFDSIPPVIKLENYRFYIISNIAYTLGWVIHVAWFFVFYSLGIYTMMFVQIVSTSCHIIAIALNRRGRHEIAMIIGMLEVVVHPIVAVYLLGWGCGFQSIILAITLFPFLKPDTSWIIKAFLAITCVVSYLYLEVFVKNSHPVYILSHTAETAFNYSNIFLCFIFWF